MRLPTEFIRLPLTFDAARLADEIAQFDESQWRPHPEGHPGNSALSLVAIDGDPNNDSVKGRMRPTPHLERCPYVREVLASFRAPVGRTRLMRIDGNAEAKRHSDTNYYWLRRMRIHVPVVTDPAVSFLCGEQSVHMAAGEAWIFDTWKVHNVINPNPTRRIHLVCDTAGSPYFLSLVNGGAPLNETTNDIEFESQTHPVVMSPDEQAALLEVLRISDRALLAETERFLDDWRSAWQTFGERRRGWTHYRALLERYDAALARLPHVALDNNLDAAEMLRQALIRPALNPELAPRAQEPRRRIERPIFIVSSPRAGSTLLFETLAQSPGVFTPGGESHAIIEGIDALHPAQRGWESNRLTEADATPIIASVLETRFLATLRSRDGGRHLPPRVRMLEKTPKNALRIPFLKALHPDAVFIYLYRDPRATISSMLDAWRSGKFVTYPQIDWSLVLVPGWREVMERPLAERVAYQWSEATRIMLDDLEALPPESWCVASYDALVADPQNEIERLCAFAGIAWDRKLTAPLPLSRHTLTEPAPDKWRRNGEEIDSIADRIAPVASRARELFARTPSTRMRIALPSSNEGALTNTFADVLQQERCSLLVATGSEFVVFPRTGEGACPPTGTRSIAVGADRLAIATPGLIWDYRRSDVVRDRLGEHDACFIPRNAHVTGDLEAGEMAFDADGVLWIVNTRFSALCTLDADHSFVPRWRPEFISELRPDDRCHLSGLAMVDGRPRYVTAYSETDTPNGWRTKSAAGVLIDVESGATLVRGLTMPHAPRWYAGKLWLLGSQSLMYVDRKVEIVAKLPGVPRGLAFAGSYAFIGVTGGVRGVWIVDIRSGTIAGFLKFEDAIRDVVDVQLLHGIERPAILDARSELVLTHFEVPRGSLSARDDARSREAGGVRDVVDDADGDVVRAR